MASFVGVDESKGQCANPKLGSKFDRLAIGARDPDWRVRALQRFGNDAPVRHREILAVVSGIWVRGHHPRGLADCLHPHIPLLVRVDTEPFQLNTRARLSGAPSDTTVADQVEGCNPLSYSGRMVVFRRHQNNAMSKLNLGCALAARGEKHLWSGRVGVFLKKVVFDLPDVVDAQPIGQFYLVQRFLEQTVFVAFVPGSGDLVFVENPEFHRSSRGESGASVATAPETVNKGR